MNNALKKQSLIPFYPKIAKELDFGFQGAIIMISEIGKLEMDDAKEICEEIKKCLKRANPLSKKVMNESCDAFRSPFQIFLSKTYSNIGTNENESSYNIPELRSNVQTFLNNMLKEESFPLYFSEYERKVIFDLYWCKGESKITKFKSNGITFILLLKSLCKSVCKSTLIFLKHEYSDLPQVLKYSKLWNNYVYSIIWIDSKFKIIENIFNAYYAKLFPNKIKYPVFSFWRMMSKIWIKYVFMPLKDNIFKEFELLYLKLRENNLDNKFQNCPLNPFERRSEKIIRYNNDPLEKMIGSQVRKSIYHNSLYSKQNLELAYDIPNIQLVVEAILDISLNEITIHNLKAPGWIPKNPDGSSYFDLHNTILKNIEEIVKNLSSKHKIRTLSYCVECEIKLSESIFRPQTSGEIKEALEYSFLQKADDKLKNKILSRTDSSSDEGNEINNELQNSPWVTLELNDKVNNPKKLKQMLNTLSEKDVQLIKIYDTTTENLQNWQKKRDCENIEIIEKNKKKGLNFLDDATMNLLNLEHEITEEDIKKATLESQISNISDNIEEIKL